MWSSVLNGLKSTVHTRQRDLVHQPYVRTRTALNSFFIACIKEWNKLPLNIKNSTTLSRFKVMCQKYLYDRLKNCK